MKHSYLKIPVIFLNLLLLQTCVPPSPTYYRINPPDYVPAGPAQVKIRQNGYDFSLLKDGKPYYIKGAGYWDHMDRLAASGGNSIRTWSTENALELLDEAQQRGLTATLGLDVARERHGFDYSDSAAVAQQLERLRGEVLQYKDHPALLMWGIGNELNLHYTNPKVWDAVNDIARMIHKTDSNHLATTMLAGLHRADIEQLKERAPELDLLAINAYGALPHIPEQLRRYGWDKAYIISEWGPTGYWEVPTTAWGAPIEESSSEKAAVYKSRYEASMQLDVRRNLGSYVFFWGQKQERTPTWFNLFTEAGEETEVVDVMQYLWTGSWPKNRAPHMDSLLLNGKKATANIYLKPGATYTAEAFVREPEGDSLHYRWELLPESTDLKHGGDWERRPGSLEGHFIHAEKGQLELKTPQQEGAYRLFVYVSDGKNKVATANLPFFVKK